MTMDQIKQVILNTDAGTDDAMAILIFLYAMKLGMVKIEAIICSNGNTDRENVVKNVVRLLELTGNTDIPVYRGAKHHFIKPREPLDHYHGRDGFGDLNDDYEPDLNIVRDTPGALAMYELVTKYPNRIYLVSLAALTDIALADRLFEDFLSNVKEIWLMGGNYKGIGNTQGTGEFNFFADPEAAHIILSCSQLKINVLPWETCSSSIIPRDWRFDVLGKSTKPEFELLTRAEVNVHKSHEKTWACCDGQLATSFIFPDKMILTKNEYAIDVELHGSQTRGQVTVNRRGTIPNASIIEKVDYSFYQEVLMKVAEIQ